MAVLCGTPVSVIAHSASVSFIVLLSYARWQWICHLRAHKTQIRGFGPTRDDSMKHDALAADWANRPIARRCVHLWVHLVWQGEKAAKSGFLIEDTEPKIKIMHTAWPIGQHRKAHNRLEYHLEVWQTEFQDRYLCQIFGFSVCPWSKMNKSLWVEVFGHSYMLCTGHVSRLNAWLTSYSVSPMSPNSISVDKMSLLIEWMRRSLTIFEVWPFLQCCMMRSIIAIHIISTKHTIYFPPLVLILYHFKAK